MAVTQVVKRLAQVTATNAEVDVYTVGAGTKTHLRDMFVCNFSNTSRYYTVNLKASGDSAALKNTIISQRPLAAYGTDQWRFNTFMDVGDKISLSAEISSVIAFQVSGVENTGTFVATTPKRLAQALATTSYVTYYTGVGSHAILKDLLICNNTGSAATFYLDIVKSGGSLGTNTEVINNYSIAARATIQFRMSTVIDLNDTVRVKSDTISALSFTLSGLEVA